MTYITVSEIRERLRSLDSKSWIPDYTVDRIHNEAGEPTTRMGLFKAKLDDSLPTMTNVVGTGKCLLKSVIVDDKAVFLLEAAEDVIGKKIK